MQKQASHGTLVTIYTSAEMMLNQTYGNMAYRNVEMGLDMYVWKWGYLQKVKDS